MEHRKLTKADIDKVRSIEGFPIGSDEDIIALSDAPYYTACPNPFIEDFIREHGAPYDEESDDEGKKPFTEDVSEDKHDLIYNIHTYHTKVPPKAIMTYLEHYTKPNDLVLDVFGGSGMTGVATQMCASGQRNAILMDISPYSTFLCANYNSPNNGNIITELEELISSLERQYSDYYRTNHVIDGHAQLGIDGKPMQGFINYTIWSDVFFCPHCGHEMVYYDAALDNRTKKAMKKFHCPKCNFEITKLNMVLKKESEVSGTGEIIEYAAKVPVLINYSIGTKRYFKVPDEDDLRKIESAKATEWIPTDELPKGYNTEQPKHSHGMCWVNSFYTRRTQMLLGAAYAAFKDDNKKKFLFTSILPKMTLLNRYMPEHGSRALVGPMVGTYYIPSLSVENNAINQLRFQLKKLQHLSYEKGNILVSTQSATDLSNIASNTIDYIFVDPPFGANIMYSELNFMPESWLKVKTNNKEEAIINNVQGKALPEYTGLMTRCFRELFRILKPNHWITIEFHNSKNAVWNAIQQSLQSSGFIIADVRTLSKEKKTVMQYKSSNTVDQDLVISAYKPKQSFEREFVLKAGTEDAVWSFVRQHLANVPVVVDSGKNGKLDIVAERQAFLLFDRMVSYHIMQGYAVPVDATDFYKGLDDRFLKRDGMYFLPDQVNEYDMARSTMEVENIQFSLFVSDEKSAIGWLYQQLDENNGEGRMTYAELQPKFMKELQAVDKREKMPELMKILEENFLKDDDGKWYIPDLTKSGDLAKLREKNLLKEFQSYLESKGKLKVFRSEAIRAGFAKLWKDKDYKSIVAVAERLPEATIQGDPNLLMYYDISLSRV
jgi:DNA methylase N-4/N-6 domain protein